MPRKARLDAPGALHHIMVRGIDKTNIFVDHQDKALFLERLGENITEGQCSVYAWVLMDNHLHILFKSGKHGISVVMRKQLTWYAQYFNHRHKRTGHLFQNRYKSILCDEENYLLALIRYIHLNPVRAKIVKTIGELDRYPWSGHSAIVGKANRSWMDIDTVLSQFGEKKKRALLEYRRFIMEEFGQDRKPELTGGGLIRSQGGWSRVLALQRSGKKEEADERILGAGEFVHAVMREVEERQLRQTKLRRRGKGIVDIIREECEKRGVNERELIQGSRRQKVSRTRAIIALRCKKEIGSPGAEIARHLGVNTSSINRAVERAEVLSSD
jgi:REP element-mobilizing transposase RayT